MDDTFKFPLREQWEKDNTTLVGVNQALGHGPSGPLPEIGLTQPHAIADADDGSLALESFPEATVPLMTEQVDGAIALSDDPLGQIPLADASTSAVEGEGVEGSPILSPPEPEPAASVDEIVDLAEPSYEVNPDDKTWPFAWPRPDEDYDRKGTTRPPYSDAPAWRKIAHAQQAAIAKAYAEGKRREKLLR